MTKNYLRPLPIWPPTRGSASQPTRLSLSGLEARDRCWHRLRASARLRLADDPIRLASIADAAALASDAWRRKVCSSKSITAWFSPTASGGTRAGPSAAIVDRQSIQTTEGSGYKAAKRKLGHNRQRMTENDGRPHTLLAYPANVQDLRPKRLCRPVDSLRSAAELLARADSYQCGLQRI